MGQGGFLAVLCIPPVPRSKAFFFTLLKLSLSQRFIRWNGGNKVMKSLLFQRTSLSPLNINSQSHNRLWALGAFTHSFTVACFVLQAILQFLPVCMPGMLAASESSVLYTHCHAVILRKGRAGKEGKPLIGGKSRMWDLWRQPERDRSQGLCLSTALRGAEPEAETVRARSTPEDSREVHAAKKEKG